MIFVNDSPYDSVVLENHYPFDVEIITNSSNYGIHQSRINGLRASHGDYISFCDQDDKWSPYFLKSQLEHIGNADAIFCDALYRNGIHCFDSEQAIDRVTSNDWYMRHLTGIISPGQAVIRRSSIPEEWTKYVIHTNYCDDAFLWLLMKEHKCSFAVNRECLYTHVEDGNNTSVQWDRNIESFKDMQQLIDDNNLLSSDNLILFRQAISERISIMQDCMNAEKMINDISEHPDRYKKEFKTKGYEKISVYGFGNIGVELVKALAENDFSIAHIYDRDAVSDEYHIERLENSDDSDVIILSILLGRKKIIDWVKSRTSAEVISILDMKFEE